MKKKTDNIIVVAKIHGSNVYINTDDKVVASVHQSECDECELEQKPKQYSEEELIRHAEEILKQINDYPKMPYDNMVEISKWFKADIAHFVPTQILPPEFEPKCRRLHGHTVKIRLNIIGKINPKTRMIIDYTLLKDFKDFIDNYIDHHFLLSLRQIEETLGEEALIKLVEVQNVFNQIITGLIYEDGVDVSKVTIVYKDLTVQEIEQPTIIEGNDNDIFLIKVGSFSILNTPSTTAEDLAEFFKEVASSIITNLQLKGYVDDSVYVSDVTFKETENSEAIAF